MKKIFLIILVLLTILPFFNPGLFDVHDPTSAFRIYSLVETIKSGQFPAAWSNLLNFGYGYPLHLYYAPLFGYLGAIFVPLFSYEVAVKLALVVSSLIGTLGMYKLLRSHVGSYASLLGAASFTFLPYRASALYVRGSYSEFLAMSLLPWVIYFWQKPQKTKQIILPTAILSALFVLSHNTLLILFIPILLLEICLFQTKNIRGSLSTLLLIFGFTSWFILPVFFERSFVQVDTIARLTHFSDHFVTISQLWYSRWGYGGSTAGIAGDNMSFMIGKGQLILAIIGALALAKKGWWKSLTLFVSITAFSVFLTLESSRAIWELFPILSVMQFPWRSLAVAGVGVAVLSGYSLEILPKRLRFVALSILTILLVTTNLSYFKPQEYRNYNQDILSSPNNLDPLVRDKIPEYLPTWMPQPPLHRQDDGLTHTSISSYGTITWSDSGPIMLATAYMPQWKLKVDGRDVEISKNGVGAIMTPNLSYGTHNLELTWHRTFIEQVGLWISGLTILTVIGLLVL